MLKEWIKSLEASIKLMSIKDDSCIFWEIGDEVIDNIATLTVLKESELVSGKGNECFCSCLDVL